MLQSELNCRHRTENTEPSCRQQNADTSEQHAQNRHRTAQRCRKQDLLSRRRAPWATITLQVLICRVENGDGQHQRVANGGGQEAICLALRSGPFGSQLSSCHFGCRTASSKCDNGKVDMSNNAHWKRPSDCVHLNGWSQRQAMTRGPSIKGNMQHAPIKYGWLLPENDATYK